MLCALIGVEKLQSEAVATCTDSVFAYIYIYIYVNMCVQLL